MELVKGQRVEVMAPNGRWDAATVRGVESDGRVRVHRDMDPRGSWTVCAACDVRPEDGEDWETEARRNYHADLLPRR
jgi:hypothetical protein